VSNAFTAGVEPGGLRSLEEIKILVCYLLNSINEPLPRQMVPEIIAGNGMANFFDVGGAMDELIQMNHIAEAGSGLLSLTDTGKEIADTLSYSLPFTLRERSVQAALQLLARVRSQKDSEVTISSTEHGYLVTCRLKDGAHTMLSVSVTTADMMQANVIKDTFREDPAVLYRAVMAVLNRQTEQDGDTLKVLL
jgi:hypothetical protein